MVDGVAEEKAPLATVCGVEPCRPAFTHLECSFLRNGAGKFLESREQSAQSEAGGDGIGFQFKVARAGVVIDEAGAGTVGVGLIEFDAVADVAADTAAFQNVTGKVVYFRTKGAEDGNKLF